MKSGTIAAIAIYVSVGGLRSPERRSSADNDLEIHHAHQGNLLPSFRQKVCSRLREYTY